MLRLFCFNYLYLVGKFTRITSFFLSSLIVMMHVVILLHTLTHENHEIVNETSALTFEKDLNVEAECSICDTYLDIVISEFQLESYCLPIADCFIQKTLQKEDNLISIILFFKQSRSPPFYNI